MSIFKKDELSVITREDIDIRDEENPNSIINLVPGSVANAIKMIPLDVLCMPEAELKEAARADIVENRLRHAFWLEYGHAVLGKRKMNMAQVYNGVCRREYFNQHVVTNSFRMAFILTPPPDYKVQMAELLTLGLSQIREILTLPTTSINQKTGEIQVDARLAGVKARIVEDLMTRTHGHPLKSIEVTSKNMNVNVDATAQADPREIVDLDQRIKELERELGGGSDRKLIDVPNQTKKRS